MKTIHTIIGWAVGTAFGLSGCTTDADIELPVPGNVPVALSGIMTRGAEANGYPNLFLMAKAGDSDNVYISEIAISCAGLETTTAKDITIGNVFYPIGDTKIRFFAYSGTTTAGNMALTAGTERANDAILSNYGTPGTVTDTSTEGEGTPGTAKAPAKVLQFRHVMTKLNVSVVVDNTEPIVEPAPENITLTIEGAVQKGNYPITAITTATATDPNPELYTLQKGDNYLVPTGGVLSGTGIIKSLIIDDYIATDDDLTGFIINKASTNTESTELKLLPGYSYDLEFKVKRLKVTGITIKKVDWVATEIKDNDVSYTPQELVLDLGSYNTTANKEDTITKVVLYEKVETANKAKQYVGDYLHTKGFAKFVTLPPATATVDSVELYTSKGLLINGAKPTGYADNADNKKKLTLLLSAGGMLLEKPSEANSVSNPYPIKTALQFLNVSKDLTAHYKQGVSIDMERLNDAEIAPLGAMTGSYDGNGFQILHLNLKGAGLFTSNSGTLTNIRIVSGTVNGTGDNVGGICGSNSGTIVACTNQARVINAQKNVGGICGSNSGTITACLNTGNIPSGTTVGGICGTNTNIAEGAITACVNTGMLNRTAEKLAGVCGTTTTSSSNTKVLKVCYWLTGTAEKNQGNAAGNGGADWDNNGGLNNEVGVNGVDLDDAADVADLSPQKLRDNETITLLNAAIITTQYHFVLDAQTTGCTWPIPVIKETINKLLQ